MTAVPVAIIWILRWCPTTREEKFSYIHQLLMNDLPPETSDGAIVYCATQRQTEEVAEFLQAKEIAADYLPRQCIARDQEERAAAFYRR